MRVKIYWASEQSAKKVNFGLRHLIKKAIRTTLSCEDFNRNAIVSVTLTDDEGIREKNREFREIDAPTDVLSFPMYDILGGDEPEEELDVELGDIVLNLTRAEEQAAEFGHSYARECAFLTVHSTLHLLGYDHVNSEEEDEEMRARQRVVMKKLGLERKQEN